MVNIENTHNIEETRKKLIQDLIEATLNTNTPQKQPEEKPTYSEIMTVSEAAKYLKVCVATMRKELKKGRMPFFTVRGQKRVSMTALQEWINDQERKGA